MFEDKTKKQKNKKVSFAQYQNEPDALLWSELPNNIQTKIKSSNLMHPHCIVDRKNENKKGRDIPVRPFFFLHKKYFFLVGQCT